jgi:hypothetical protein
MKNYRISILCTQYYDKNLRKMNGVKVSVCHIINFEFEFEIECI